MYTTPDELLLECVCGLLTTIGKDLDNPPAQANACQSILSLNPYFQRISDLALKRGRQGKLTKTSKVKDTIISCKRNCIIPMTTNEIIKEIKREVLEANMALRHQNVVISNKENIGDNQYEDESVNIGAKQCNKFSSASTVEVSKEQNTDNELYKNVKDMLDEITPQVFEKVMHKLTQLPINTEERLKGVVDLLYEKAVDEPSFSKLWAHISKVCSRIEITKVENGQETEVTNFRKLIIDRCQTEFESSTSEMLDLQKWAEDIINCTDPAQKHKLQMEYEEMKRKLATKSVGNVLFIGELFKLHLLTTGVMYRVIDKLLSTPDDISLECLCKLLTTIGRDLDNSSAQEKARQFLPSLNRCFQTMSDLAQKREDSKVSSRVRFMLHDVIELRQNEWKALEIQKQTTDKS